MPDMKTLTINGVQYELPFAPDELFSTKIYPKTYADFMEELRSIYTNMPNTQNTPKKFVYAGIETGGDTANGELGSGAWFVEINRGSENYGTIKASNDYYGDRRLDIYGTWGKWVDVSPKAFAPAGYGYSGTPKTGAAVFSNLSEMGLGLTASCTTEAFVKALKGHSNVQFMHNKDNAVHLTDAPFDYGNVEFHKGANDNYIYGIGVDIKGNIYVYKYHSSQTATNGWYYDNPPMLPGVEYRTTERCNGRAVYAKRVQYSNSSAIAADNSVVDTKIPHGISNFSELVRCDCWKNGYVLPYLKDNGGFTAIVQVESTDITLRVFKANWSPSTWNIDLYYVKS